MDEILYVFNYLPVNDINIRKYWSYSRYCYESSCKSIYYFNYISNCTKCYWLLFILYYVLEWSILWCNHHLFVYSLRWFLGALQSYAYCLVLCFLYKLYEVCTWRAGCIHLRLWPRTSWVSQWRVGTVITASQKQYSKKLACWMGNIVQI